MENVNYLAVFVSAISTFILGGIWYSPKLFGSTWKQQSQKEAGEEKQGHSKLIFVYYFLLSLMAAYAFAFHLGASPELYSSVIDALLISVFFISTSFAVNYMFSGRGIKLFIIDSAYYVLQFVLYAVILSLWH